MGVFSEIDNDSFDNMDEDGFVDLDDDGEDAEENAGQPTDTEPMVEATAVTTAEQSESTTDTAAVKKATDDEKRRLHEESEAKRKAEWQEKHDAKKAADEKAIQEYMSLSEDDLVNAAVKRVGNDTERLTRRNMKDCVTEYVQTMCFDDPVLARNTMHPRKNMINCFKYITRLALEFIRQDLKDNGEPVLGFGMGSDVPDDLCYKWAVDYFNDPDAEEDKDNDDEFVPKQYYGGYKKPEKAKTEPKKKVEKPKPSAPVDDGQLTLGAL